MTTHCNCNGNLIPSGNDFYLAITLKSRILVDGKVVETPFDFEAADTYNARIYGILDGTTLSTMVGLKDGTTDTVIVDAKGVPLIRAIGVEVTGEVDGRAFRAAEKGFLSIVEFNGEARVVFTPVTGGQEANLVMTLTFLPSAAVVGKNAYEIWKEEPGNHDKTLDDFINYLGRGESAYEIAVRYGYTGTEAEYNWLYFDAVDVANTAGQNAQQAADTANQMAAQAQDAAELADAATTNANNAATATAATVAAAIDNMEDTLNAAIAAQDAEIASKEAEIDEQFATQTALINQKQMEVGAVPSDLTPTAGSTNWVTSGGIKNALRADNISYDNSQSGLAAENVQGALDEITLKTSANDSAILKGQGIVFKQGLFNSSGEIDDYNKGLVTTSLVQGGQFITVKDGYCIRRVGKCNATTGVFIEMYAADDFTRRVLYLDAGYSYIVSVAHQNDTVISPSEDVLYSIYPYGYKTINTTDNPDEFVNGKASTIGFLPSDTDKSFFHRIDYEGQVFYGQYWNTAGNIRGLWICDNNQGENAVRISSGTTAGGHNEFYQATASDVGKYICISSEIGTGKVIKCSYYNMWHPLDSASVSDDFCIQDKNGNSIIQVNGGYIKTQNFDSSTFDYKELYGKKVVFIGDSITEASYGYHQRFAALTGCIAVNLGVSGSSIAARPAPYANVRFETRATAENLAGASLIVVFGGTNDFDGDVYPIGELFSYIEDTPQYRYGGKTIVAPSDTQAFGGAVHQLINKIRTNAAGVPIMFITPLDRYFEATTPADRRPMSNEYNNHMETIQDYRNAIDAICQFYGIPVFHAEHIPQLEPGDATFADEYFLDKLHPNVQGHIILGTCLYKWVKNNLYFK